MRIGLVGFMSGLAMLFCNALCSDWNPAMIPSQEFFNELFDSSFIDLRQKVKAELAGGWCSPEKADLLMDLVFLTRPQVCVEVGVFTGSSILPLAATLKYLNSGRIYAVDAWSNKVATQNLDDGDPNKSWWSTVNMPAVFNQFVDLIKRWSLVDYCTIVRKPSKWGVREVPRNIDFLHIDGDYSEVGSLEDVELYLPRVRLGGYILLSNFYLMVGREQPKVKAFCVLCEECDVVASIEKDNAVLFRKTVY